MVVLSRHPVGLHGYRCNHLFKQGDSTNYRVGEIVADQPKNDGLHMVIRGLVPIYGLEL